MRKHRILRIRSSSLELELHSSAFAQAEAAAPTEWPAPDPDLCECTHSITERHNETGCLEGCPAELCARTGAIEAQA